MEAATASTQHSHGPSPAHGAQNQAPGAQNQAPGAQHQQAASGSSGAPRPDEQRHHKPFFYVQPPQPCLPVQGLQWPVPVPMPVPYNPYYGYPGLGFGMPLIPGYQTHPYLEPPAFVVPHTHLHLMDYRRVLNPQYYQTMAYHSRRFRYQHNPQSREMTSSEVQTEPLSAAQKTSTPSSGGLEASSVPVPAQTLSLSPASAQQEGDLEIKDVAPASAAKASANGSSFVIQTEEVRIECCTTPVGLQLVHARETAEVSHGFPRDVVQSILQGHMLQDKALHLPADESEQSPRAGPPGVPLREDPAAGDQIPALEGSRKSSDPANTTSDLEAPADAQDTSCETDPSSASRNFHFRVVHLPFDPKYLDELRKMESSVWSAEETSSRSHESLIRPDLTGSQGEVTMGEAEVPSADAVLNVREEAPGEEVVPGSELVPAADEAQPAGAAPYRLLMEDSPLPVEGIQHKPDLGGVQDQQDTSFESLPAYLPSTSWLADFDGVYYCRKLPPTPQKQSRPPGGHGLDLPSRRRKLDLDYKEPPTSRKAKERYKPKGKAERRSVSDHECCLGRRLNENAFALYASRRERLCSRCLAKRRGAGPASPGLDPARKADPLQQRNESLVPTCEACKFHGKKPAGRKGDGVDVRGRHHGHDTEGESSENGSSCRVQAKWRPGDVKRPLASKQNLAFPAVVHARTRAKNCSCCDESRERPRHCPHGNAIREMDENCAALPSLQDRWRNLDLVYLRHRWQTGRGAGGGGGGLTAAQ
ncbi:uncharacterized protein V6R79_020932 [Siganus canaliculatus]